MVPVKSSYCKVCNCIAGPEILMNIKIKPNGEIIPLKSSCSTFKSITIIDILSSEVTHYILFICIGFQNISNLSSNLRHSFKWLYLEYNI